jgi:hypothetical protein
MATQEDECKLRPASPPEDGSPPVTETVTENRRSGAAADAWAGPLGPHRAGRSGRALALTASARSCRNEGFELVHISARFRPKTCSTWHRSRYGLPFGLPWTSKIWLTAVIGRSCIRDVGQRQYSDPLNNHMETSMIEHDRARELSQDLAVYQGLSDQYLSVMTMMWQAPALGLTAEAFLMTITLNSGLSRDVRIISSLLGALVALMSMHLMEEKNSMSQRDKCALMRLEKRLGISSRFEEVPSPGRGWAANITSYKANITSYKVWQAGLLLFVLANLSLALLAISAEV